ncbi:MAG: hypothetical protein L0Y71_21840, partial [Gemmataceae bacterium]|nr:hypothetical protein [Gemmataceae bacterium]
MLASYLLCGLLGAGAGQEGKLEISNPRGTYGHLGAVRPKSKGILPGDVAHFTFDINNLKHDAKGQASYSIAIEVRDGDGEIFYKQAPHNSVAQNFFGGASLPCSAHVEVPLTAKPGMYSWTVTIEDRLSKQSTSLKGQGQVLAPDFGLIRIGTYADADGKVPAPPVGVVGSTLYVNFAAVNFGRNKKDKQPDLKVEMSILDENGKATFTQPISGRVNKDIPEALKILPLQYGV